MFVETQGQVLNRLQASLFDTHADWQTLFMADALAALDLISRRKAGIVLANSGMDKPVVQGLIQLPRDSVENLTG
jgi:hypothetical protein